MYLKDDEIYPIAMTKEQLEVLQLLGKMLEPIQVINKSQGKAVNLTE